MPFRPALLLIFTLLLTSCGGRATGVLEPVPTAQSVPGKTVHILVATTRSDAGIAPGDMFGGGRAERMAYADLAIAIPPAESRKEGEIQWPSSIPGDPARDFVTLSADKLTRAQAFTRLHHRVNSQGQKRILLFVHGFNTRFDEAVYRFAQITHDSDAPAVPVLFTWPSRGKMLAYTYDRESANYSRDALEGLLQDFNKDPAIREVTVLAHSMGNWVILEALRQMAIRHGRISPKIKNVMMASPDVDVDVFRRQIAEIGPHHPPFIVFVSRDDKALALSQRIWGNHPRLGAIDPTQGTYRSFLAKEKIQVVDLTDIQSRDSFNHGKFADNPDIVRLIGGRLAAGQNLNEATNGLSEKITLFTTGAAATIGRAASITLTTPLAILDAPTRRQWPEQVEDLKDQATQTLDTTIRIPR